MKLFGTNVSLQEAYIYGEAPNVFFREIPSRILPGRLLLPGEGEGRNAVWAATVGWDVTAVDYSISGKAKALKLISNENRIDYQIQDLAQLKVSENTYGCCCFDFRASACSDQTSRSSGKLVKSLVPGGLLIIEAFHKDQSI